MPPVIFTLALLLAFASPASAQVYKCQSQNNNVVYSDAPCKSGTQTLTDIPVTAPTALNGNSQTSAITRQMDTAVKSAIATDDLQRAQALATTREHWEWIAAARQNADQKPTLGRTEADLSAERGDTQACQQATRSYELEANSSFDEPEALEAKRSIMRAACGIKEPLQVNNQPTPATVFYPGLRTRPQFRQGQGFGYPRRPGWRNDTPRNPVVTEPPAVSVIVGPSKK